jgi:hypothetical protein
MRQQNYNLCAQLCYLKGNGDVCEHAIQLESLISIRIWSREPGQHLLVNQCLLGVGGEPLASRVFLAIVAETHLWAVRVCFYDFELRSEQSSSFLYLLTAVFTSKTRLLDTPAQSRKCEQWLNCVVEHCHLLAFGCS